MIAYVDTSVILRAVFADGPVLRFWEHDLQAAATSTLARVEAHRTLQRQRLNQQLDDRAIAQSTNIVKQFLDGLGSLELTPQVLSRAAQPFPTHIKTLDALHLATALLWQQLLPDETLVFMTHDTQQAQAALASGLQVSP